MPNLETVKLILDKLGKPHSLISFVTDRLGHDRRYAIDSSFAKRELGWKPLHTVREGIAATVRLISQQSQSVGTMARAYGTLLIIWGAHAPRVLVWRPRQNELFLWEKSWRFRKEARKIGQDEGVLASTRGRVRSPIHRHFTIEAC